MLTHEQEGGTAVAISTELQPPSPPVESVASVNAPIVDLAGFWFLLYFAGDYLMTHKYSR